MLKQITKRALLAIGLEVRRKGGFPDSATPVEFTKADTDVLDFVIGNRLSMVSRQRLIATIKACKHAVEADTAGDFVECGVWRGGNSIAAKLTFQNYGSDKKVWMFDTYAGMTMPTEEDRVALTGEAAADQFDQFQRDDHSEWCYASIEDVRHNMASAGVKMDGVRLVQGDVAESLRDESNLPAAISVLRLDTDWYASTRDELEILYPRLSKGGSLLLDDFGFWDGSRKAVEEYFAALPATDRPLLHFTDHTGRMGVKP